VLKAVAARDPEKVKQFAHKWGYEWHHADWRRLVDAVKKAGVRTMVWYNYRRIPAVTLAKQIIASGKLSQIYHYG
jgi:predicted dehydrogenase